MQTLRLTVLLVLLGATAAPAQGIIAGEKKVNFVYIAWTGETPKYPDGVVSGAKMIAGLNATWQRASFGKMWVTGRGWGPYLVPKRTVNTTALLGQLIAEVRALASARGDSWVTEAVIVGWIAPQISLNSQTTSYGFLAVNGGKYEHEYGHTLGFGHSKALSYVGTTRTMIEYGPFDVMGTGGYGINVPLRKRSGWVDAAGTPATTTAVPIGSALVSLDSADLAAPIHPVAAVFCGGTYEVEQRQDGRIFLYENVGFNSFVLRDLDPTTTQDYVLDVGQSFTPPNCTQTVTTVSTTRYSAVIQIAEGPWPVPPPPPCEGSVGQNGEVTVAGQRYRVTITSSECGASVMGPL